MKLSDVRFRTLWDRLKRLGPTIIVAAVVLGPGSIVNASRVGCEYGYSLLWVVPLAGLLMMGMTIAAMRIGVLDDQTPCQKVAARFGRLPACLVGLSLLVAITLFQASNNNAILMAAEGILPDAISATTGVAFLFVLNAAVIAMLLAGRTNLYRLIERSMTLLVGTMLVAFAASLWAAAPHWGDVAGGFVPQLPSVVSTDPGSSAATSLAPVSWMSIAALMATTFSVAGAFFQSYQVREKGWGPKDLSLGSFDSVVGIGTLTLITAILLMTSAAALHGRVPVSELTNATAVAGQLEPMFGRWASVIFSIGVLAGAVSSFVVNALIGGVVAVDSLGHSSRFDDVRVRWATAATLSAGFLVAAGSTLSGVNLVRFIVVAQSLTVLTFPLLALVVLWHLSTLPRRHVRWWLLAVVAAGLLVVVALSIRTIMLLLA